MAKELPFYEDKKFVSIVLVAAVAIALFAMFSTTNAGMAFLRTVAAGVMP